MIPIKLADYGYLSTFIKRLVCSDTLVPLIYDTKDKGTSLTDRFAKFSCSLVVDSEFP